MWQEEEESNDVFHLIFRLLRSLITCYCVGSFDDEDDHCCIISREERRRSCSSVPSQINGGKPLVLYSSYMYSMTWQGIVSHENGFISHKKKKKKFNQKEKGEATTGLGWWFDYFFSLSAMDQYVCVCVGRREKERKNCIYMPLRRRRLPTLPT